MRIGIGVFACAVMAAGGVEAQDVAGQMRAGFEVCADMVAGRTDVRTSVAAANARGFVGDGGATMAWTGPGDGMRVRLSLYGGPGWCAISTSDPSADASLPDQAMGWAAERLPGPWRHARQDQATALNAYAITGHNGRAGVTATRPTGGGVRIMVIETTFAEWSGSEIRVGAQPVTLDLPGYSPPAFAEPQGPPLRDTVLSVLGQCKAFVDGGDRPGATSVKSGVRLILADPSAPRACAVEVTATPMDLTLMDEGLRIVEADRRGFNRRRQETGFSCMMHQVTLETRDLSSVAACDRMAPSGQVWLSFRLEAR